MKSVRCVSKNISGSISLLDRINFLLDHFPEREIVSLTSDNNPQRINLYYNNEGHSSHFILEYSPSCLEVYGIEEVPPYLVDALSQALPGAKYERYNPRTHYWSGKAIDDYFQIS